MSEMAKLMDRRSELHTAWMTWVAERKASGNGAGVRAVGPILAKDTSLSLYVWVDEVRYGDLVARPDGEIEWVFG